MICIQSQASDCDVVTVRYLGDKKLWSLTEMIKFMAWQLMRTQDILKDITGLLTVIVRVPVPQELITTRIKPALDYCRMQYSDIELRQSVQRIDDHIFIKLRDEITYPDLKTELRVLQETVDAELIGHQFAYIAQGKTKEYLNWQHTWKRVLCTFPDAKPEIEQGVICFSVELYTATVFHMMRVAELGLRDLATKIGVSLKHSIELGDWSTILTAVDDKLDQLHNSQKTPTRQAELKWYSDAASHLRYMKAWRNDMAHCRSAYGEGDAQSALTRVRELMELMCPVASP